MTRQDARANIDRLRWAGVPGGAARYNTGGSSGEPLIFYVGRWRQASDAAGRIRARRWWGVDVGDREAYLWGGEYWYYRMSVLHDPSLWNTARQEYQFEQ